MIWPSCRVNYPVGDLFPLRRDAMQVTEYKRESGTDGGPNCMKQCGKGLDSRSELGRIRLEPVPSWLEPNLV